MLCRTRTTAFRALLLVVGAAGCVAPGSPTRSESDLLPQPGARVELGSVTNATGVDFDVDVASLLRAAMQEALRDEGLAWSPGDPAQRFRLDLEIADYRPGNAFKRWLLPGYGSTVLGVRGRLGAVATGELAASVDHRRSVHAGGAYTIGAWKTIFPSVAGDIARDLQCRIERGGQFVVYLAPRAEQEAAPEPHEGATRIRITGVVDERVDRTRIGERAAAFGVSMGEVQLARRVPDVVWEALVDDLLAGGHRVVEAEPDVTVEGRVLQFWVHTDTTPFYWDVVGDIGLRLRIQPEGRPPLERQYACHRVQRTYVWPTASLLGAVLDACLAELGERIRSDDVWRRERPRGQARGAAGSGRPASGATRATPPSTILSAPATCRASNARESRSTTRSGERAFRC